MAKFTLVPRATFKHAILIPVAGGEDLELKMTFNHLTLEDLKKAEEDARIQQEEAREQADRPGEYVAMATFIKLIAAGWELKDEFSLENIIVACSRYPRFFDSVLQGYTRELWCLREKR